MGGAYVRLAFNTRRAVRAYTPHGGSLHYGRDTLAGKLYLTTERLLTTRGDLFLFESAYSADTFRHKIGAPHGLVRIVHNGVAPAEFEPVALAPDASDLLFLGELRLLKGVDLLLDALASLKRSGRTVTATLVGDGPDAEAFRAQVRRLGLEGTVRFQPAMPARDALARGRIMVVPSRAESLPYVVLETAASGKPLIVTRVGGIPEIYGPLADRLVPPGDAEALAAAIAATLDDPEAAATAAGVLRARIAAAFTVEAMVEGVMAGYRDGLDMLQKIGRR
jgi:glycosyltransferase involved in cell wall biosynthesis